jgi:hypothetical protein
MERIKVSLALLMFGVHGFVAAESFRGVEFGELCDGVANYEAQQGSEPLRFDPPYSYTFKGMYLGREWEVFYRCGFDGPLTEGTYRKILDNHAESERLFNHSLEQMSRKLGAPAMDMVIPPFKDVSDEQQYLGATQGASRLVQWISGLLNYRLHWQELPAGPYSDAVWSVTVMVTPSE